MVSTFNQGIIYVIDSCDSTTRFNESKLQLMSLLVEERLAGASLLIFCNKFDLQGHRSLKEISDLLGIDDIKSHHVEIIECSAYQGLNLVKGLNWIVDDISKRIYV